MAKEPSVEIAPQAPAQEEVPPLCFLPLPGPVSSGPLPQPNDFLRRQESPGSTPTDQVYNDCNSLMWATIFGPYVVNQYMGLATGGPGNQQSRPDVKQVNLALGSLREAVSRLVEWLKRFKGEPLQKLRDLLGPGTDVKRAANSNWLGWKDETKAALENRISNGEIKIDPSHRSELNTLIDDVGEKGVSYWSAKGSLQAQTQGTAKQREGRARNKADEQLQRTKADLPAQTSGPQQELVIAQRGKPSPPDSSEIRDARRKVDSRASKKEPPPATEGGKVTAKTASPQTIEQTIRKLEDDISAKKQEIERLALFRLRRDQEPVLREQISKHQATQREAEAELKKRMEKLARGQEPSDRLKAGIASLEATIERQKIARQRIEKKLEGWAAEEAHHRGDDQRDLQLALRETKRELEALQIALRAQSSAKLEQDLLAIKARKLAQKAEPIAERAHEIRTKTPPKGE